jgi:type III restriction enzyme
LNDRAASIALTAPFGLVPGAVEALRGAFESAEGLRAVWVFGSRARGDHRERSDLDLALDAPSWSERDALRFKEALQRLPLVYPLDVVLLNEATPAELRAAIERERQPFWQRLRGAVHRAPGGSIEPKAFQREALKRYADWLRRLADAEALQRKNSAHVAAMEDLDEAALDALRDTPRKVWDRLRSEGALPPLAIKYGYSSRWTAEGAQRRPIPNVCFKVPTGGGKTLLAAAAVAHTFASYYRRSTGLVLWVVPNEAIYRQARKALADRDHPYRQMLLAAGAGRVKLLEKTSPIGRADLDSHLVVLLLMLQSAARQSKETLRLFRDRGDVHGFFPREDDIDGHWRQMQAVPNLDVYAPYGVAQETARATRGSVIKDSLGNVLRLVRPMVVIDEGHHSYTPTALATIDGFNPSLVLELSATPRVADPKKGERGRGANVLVDVRGTDLDDAEMIKLPINVDVRPWPDWKSCLTAAVEKLRALDAEAQGLNAETLRYIRPILLVQVERTGKEQRDLGYIHAADARDHLLQLGLRDDEIAEKTSEKDELKQPENQDLLSPANKVRAIITKQALQEGWDCPFAYVLCALAAGRQPAALTQLVGRILRQPETLKTASAALNESYVFCNDARTGEVVKAIKASLEQEGMGDLLAGVRVSSDGAETKPRRRVRREAFRELHVFLPRVTIDDGHGRRELAYDSDVLGAIDWQALNPQALLGEWAPGEAGAGERLVRVDLSLLDRKDDDPPDSVPVPAARSQRLDRARIVRSLLDIVPNPWLLWPWLEQVLERQFACGHGEGEIAAATASLIEALRNGAAAERDRLAEAAFLARVRAGEIRFSLLASALDYQLPTEVVDAGVERPRLLSCDGRSIQKSLLEPVYEADFNGLEGEFACYLDSQSALRWWHRNVARSQYGLQGWRRDKAYPDFVFAKVTREGQNCVVVMETKGLHLACNDDTRYKQQLFARLTEMYATASGLARAGELTLEGRDGVRVICDLVMEPGWQGQMDARHFAGESAKR